MTKTTEKTEAPVEEQKPATDVAPAASTDVAVLSAAEAMLIEDAGHGNEAIGISERQIPFFAALQNGSPEVQKGGPEYIKGAESSMFMNTMTRQVYASNIAEPERGNGICFVPVHFKTKKIEWKRRDQGGGGGGLVRVWGDDTSYMQDPKYVFDAKRNRWTNPENNSEVAEHYETYGVMIGYFDGENKLIMIDPQQGVLSTKGSQVKKSKTWNSERLQRRTTVAGRSIQAPAWIDAWRIRTRYEQNDLGNWFGLEISRFKEILELDGGQSLYVGCRTMYRDVQEGLVKVNDESLGAGEAATPFSDEEVPF